MQCPRVLWRCQVLSLYTPFQTHYGISCRSISTAVSKQPVTTYKGSSNARFKSSDRLWGRTCMITGGSSGIGLAIAERYLQEGVKRVILVGRSYQRLLKAANYLGGVAVAGKPDQVPGALVATRTQEDLDVNVQGFSAFQEQPVVLLEQKLGSFAAISENISLLVGDVSLVDQWERELESQMENVDILVNAAGISISNILFGTSQQDISQMLATNLEGAILTSRALLRACVRSGLRNRGEPSTAGLGRSFSKCIINISSLLAVKGGTGAVTYAASKAGLLGLTRSTATEAANSLKGVIVRSNAIMPGYIETPMIENFSGDQVTRLKESIPLKRFGDPQEVADAAVFLAENEYANNCVLNLDGGLSAV